MEIKISNNGYNVVSSGTIIMYDADSELKFSVKASETFSFELILKFITDANEKQALDKEVTGNKIIFRCTNFKNLVGTGTAHPLSIATVSGKELLFHFWSYSMGDGDVRKIEYTFFERE